MPEQQGVAAELAQLLDQRVDALGHLVRCLAARAAVAEQLPIGVRLPDLLGRQPLELAIVEIEQRLVHRAREDVIEAAASQELADRDGLELPLGRERDIRAPGVLPRDRPLGLAVPNQPDRHRGRSLGRSGPKGEGLPQSNVCSIVP